MKYNHRNRISLSYYEDVFRTWPLNEWSVKFQPHTPLSKYRESPIPLPITHIHRDKTELLSFRTLKHSEFLIKMRSLY